jgi:hypothetical protein
MHGGLPRWACVCGEPFGFRPNSAGTHACVHVLMRVRARARTGHVRRRFVHGNTAWSSPSIPRRQRRELETQRNKLRDGGVSDARTHAPAKKHHTLSPFRKKEELTLRTVCGQRKKAGLVFFMVVAARFPPVIFVKACHTHVMCGVRTCSKAKVAVPSCARVYVGLENLDAG